MAQAASAATVTPPAASLHFEELFESEQRRLFAALWLVTRDRHEAEEIAQDAFVKVWERWDRRGAPDDPTAYLFRTAMNLFRNRRRRAAVALRKAVRPDPTPDALEAVETHDAVVRALGALTARQRAAVVLVDLFGLTSEEAGRSLGIRPATVRTLVARGRATLAAQMGEDDA